MRSNAHILTAWGWLSGGETLNATCESAIRVSCRHRPAIDNANRHVDDCTHRIVRVLQTPPNLMARFRPLHSKRFQRKPTPKTMASSDTSRNPSLRSRNLIRRRLTPVKLWWTSKILKSRYIPRLGGASVMIPNSMSSAISSITRGNRSIAPKTSNRPSDSSKPTIPNHKLIATSTNADAKFPSTFPTPPDGRCTIKSTG